MLSFFALLFSLAVLCQAFLGHQIKCNHHFGSPRLGDCKQLLPAMETRLLSLAKDGLTDPHAKTKQRLWGFPGQSETDASRCAPWFLGSCKVTLSTVGRQRISIQEVLDLAQAAIGTCVVSNNPSLGGTAHLEPHPGWYIALEAMPAPAPRRPPSSGRTISPPESGSGFVHGSSPGKSRYPFARDGD